MSRLSRLQSLTVALALLLAREAALGQVGARRALQAIPPGKVTLGRVVILSVLGAASGARYRYVAAMTATGSGARPTGPRCVLTQKIGSGSTVTWRAMSGTYRLTAYGPVGRVETDTLTLAYVVRPSSAALTSSQTQVQPGSVTLVLRASDFGAGHTYQWWMQYQVPAPTGIGNAPGPLSTPWTAQTSGPTVTYPAPISASAAVIATVSVYRSDPCEVIATDSIAPAS
jgi:hypothetical protein